MEYVNVSGGFKCILGRNNHGFRLFRVTNKAISAEPMLYAPEVLVDIVLS